jgi:hypothetical protein
VSDLSGGLVLFVVVCMISIACRHRTWASRPVTHPASSLWPTCQNGHELSFLRRKNMYFLPLAVHASVLDTETRFTFSSQIARTCPSMCLIGGNGKYIYVVVRFLHRMQPDGKPTAPLLARNRFVMFITYLFSRKVLSCLLCM